MKLLKFVNYIVSNQIQASKVCSCPLEIFSQQFMSESKFKALQASGAKISRHGKDCVEAELKARQTATVNDLVTSVRRQKNILM